jgi:Fe-S oxidoreductase
LPENGFDVARALVGTEGTCGIVLGAKVRLVSAPPAVALVVLGYPDMITAADAVPALLAHRPVALEGMDARIVDVVRRRRGSSAVPELPAGAGWLFAEVAAESPEELVLAVEALLADYGGLGHRIVTEPSEAAALWRIREDGAGLAAQAQDGRAFHSGWEDAAVPPAELGSYLRDFDALLAEHGLSGIPYGHFGDGCVHVRIDFPLAEGGVFRTFLLAAAALVARYGGSMSGEHGDGRARGELLPLMYSADALRTFEAVKDVFDPDDILNPGVIVRPRPVDMDLRIPASRPVSTPLALAYGADGGDFAAAVHRCTGVGKCRADTTAVGGVMCPSYLATGDEKDSTRGRARVLQEMVNGSLVRDGWRSAEVHESLDLCLACKGCASDCPTGVDMATYKAEVLHQTYRRRLRPASHYALGWLPRWARAASLAPRLTNWLMLQKPLAYAGKRLAGVDSRRELPAFAPTTFRRWFAEQGPQPEGDPVLLWVDTFTDHFSPEVGIAAVRVLQDAGYSVRIPERKLCCGLTWISTGQLDAARKILARSVSALAPAAADGVPIVGLEPSCIAVFRGDAAELLGDAGKVPIRTLAELLTDRPGWSPPDLSGVTAVAQPHCHHHAVMGWQADRVLLERSGAQVQAVGGCCGLAGNFGAERGHYDVSVKVAENALLPAVRAAGPDAVLLADGFSCRTQLEQLAHRSGRHLAELLADQADSSR